MAVISDAANQVWREDLEKQPDENRYQIVVPFVEERPRLAQLPEEFRSSQRPRIRGMVEKLRGWEDKLRAAQ